MSAGCGHHARENWRRGREGGSDRCGYRQNLWRQSRPNRAITTVGASMTVPPPGTTRGLKVGPAYLYSCMYRYWATNPPSTDMAWPVTNEAASEHIQTTGFGYFLRPAGPADRLGGNQRFAELRMAIGYALHHRRLNQPRADRIDPNAGLSVFQGRSFGQSNHTVLTRHIRRHAGQHRSNRPPRPYSRSPHCPA